MSRFTRLAIIILLLIPATSRGQGTLDEFMSAHAKSTGRNVGTFDSWELYRWNKFNQAGWRAFGKGYFDTAEHEFASAIEVAMHQAAVEKDHRLLARSYADYALAIQKQGRHAEAEPLIKWVLIAREAELEADSPAIAQALNQLGTLYFEVARFPEAEQILRRAAESQAKAAKPNPFEQSRSQTMLGLLMVTQHRYDEAEAPFKLALKIREKSRGPSNADTGDALSNLAWVYIQQGKNAEARPLLMRALKIFEQARGSIDPSVAHSLHGLAKIQSNEGEQEAAEAKYLQAIAIWDARPVLDVRGLVEVLKDYASFLETLGRAEDLVKIKARLTPLQSKVSVIESRPALWYRGHDIAPGPGDVLGVPRRRS